jgi:hypothetical protein
VPTSFDHDVKKLFRQKDRDCMLRKRGFDLWKYADVKQWADKILSQVQSGDMPPDGAWPQNDIEVFKQWIDGGMQS